MLDDHTVPHSEWGVCPYWYIAGLEVPAYSVCVGLALAIGVTLFLRETRTLRTPREHTLAILLASVCGGVLGAKLPYVVPGLLLYLQGERDMEVLFAGRTILGGLLGGMLAVRLMKRRLRLCARRGDYMVTGIALGLVVGRIGCFLRGCCYGTPTVLPWSVDFGDGVRRHPTELYEALFCLGWFFLGRRQPRSDRGRLFNRFMLSYFALRFSLEFVRIEPVFLFGLTAFQWVCLAAIAWLLLRWFAEARKTAEGGLH
jgi:prolipoprotein diacylglyceryltransferase